MKTIPIPLQQPDADVILNLNEIVATIYQRGAYQRQIDYTQSSPPPSLTKSEQDQWSEILEENVKHP